MEHDVIILYLIAGVSFTFALFNCILFALKHGKTMKTDGMIVSIKSTNPTNEKWRNAKLAEVSYLDRKSTRLNSSHARLSRMPSSA